MTFVELYFNALSRVMKECFLCPDTKHDVGLRTQCYKSTAADTVPRRQSGFPELIPNMVEYTVSVQVHYTVRCARWKLHRFHAVYVGCDETLTA